MESIRAEIDQFVAQHNAQLHIIEPHDGMPNWEAGVFYKPSPNEKHWMWTYGSTQAEAVTLLCARLRAVKFYLTKRAPAAKPGARGGE